MIHERCKIALWHVLLAWVEIGFVDFFLNGLLQSSSCNSIEADPN